MSHPPTDTDTSTSISLPAIPAESTHSPNAEESRSATLTHHHHHHAIHIQNVENEAPASTMIHTSGPHKHNAQTLFKNVDRGNTRKRIIITLLTLLADVVLPVALYFILKKYIDAVWALLIAGAPALLAVIVKLIVKREFDLIGSMVFGAFGVSAIIAIVTGNARVLVFEKSVVTAVLGLIFLITLIPFKIPRCGRKKYTVTYMKPFLFYISKQMIPIGTIDILSTGTEEDKLEWLWREIPRFRFDVRVLTILWGVGLMVEFIGRLIMALSPLSLDKVILYANIFFGVVLLILLIISLIYVIHAKKKLYAEIDKWLEEHHEVIVANYNKQNGTSYHHQSRNE